MSIKLKNNQTTENIKLDRIEQFDEKSRLYSIEEIRKGKDIFSYSWECNDWFDQGSEGACVGFALGHKLAARPSQVKGLTDKYLKEDIYWEAQKIDPWEGGAYPNADPVYHGTSVLAGIKVIKNLGYISEYRWAFNIDDVLYGIGKSGPAVLGVRWYDSMYETDENGFIKPEGNIVGGHAILARAVNVEEGYVTLRNSWGKDWGKDGDCYITFDNLEALLAKGGECAFMVKTGIKLPFHKLFLKSILAVLNKFLTLFGLGPKIAVFLGKVFRFIIGRK